MQTTTLPIPDAPQYAMLPFSPAAVLAHIVANEPLTYTETSAGRMEGNPFAFEVVLGLLFYELVAIHHSGNAALVVVTGRGESFVRNKWNDQEIVDACRRLRWEARGSMVVQ